MVFFIWEFLTELIGDLFNGIKQIESYFFSGILFLLLFLTLVGIITGIILLGVFISFWIPVVIISVLIGIEITCQLGKIIQEL